MRRVQMCAIPALIALSGCGEVPLSPDAVPLQSVLSGEVVIADGPASDTFLFLFAADDPPPPFGLGAPADFTGVSGASFSTVGLPSAGFALPEVEDGVWLLTAIVDRDRNFRPYTATFAGATCGDGVGGVVDAAGGLEPIPVSSGTWAQDLTALVGRTLTTERPLFTFETTAVEQVSAAAAGGAPLRLSSDRVWTRDLHIEGPLNPVDPEACRTFFPVMLVDSDLDGAPDPHPTYGDLGLPDIWPKVYLRYLGEVEEGESWAAEAAVPPLAEWLSAPMNTAIPVTELDILFLPVARHTRADGSSEQVQAPDLPHGAWSVTVVSLTGQTWTVPNELAEATSLSRTWDPIRQASVLVVQ